MLIGYARVSAADQNHESQIERLKAAGCEKVFSEKKSAREMVNREKLNECLDYVREGDTLVITKLDRIARSILDLFNIVEKLKEKNVELKVLDQPIDTTTPAGKMMFVILGAFAEFENDLRSERQREGIERAKKAGRYANAGRKRHDREVINKLLAEGELNMHEIAAKLGVSVATVSRANKERIEKAVSKSD